MRAQRNARTWLAVFAGALFAAGISGSARADKDHDKAKKENLNAQVAKKGNLDIEVNFEFDSSALDVDAKIGLDELAMWSKENKDRTIVIAGHTDEIGTQEYNLELGERRAGAAREYLIAHGVPAARITILSYGESMPASASLAANRRAVFIAQRARVGVAVEGEVTGEAELGPVGAQAGAGVALDTEPAPLVTEPSPMMYGEDDDDDQGHLITPAGLSIAVGGGVTNFIDSDTNDATDAGGAWTARLTYGTRSIIGVEAAYIGSAQDIDALGLDTSAVLMGNGGEAALRLGVPNIPYVMPYAVAGVGMTRYSLVNDDFNTSSVDEAETAVHFPLGVGVGFGAAGFLFDVRGMYRPATQDDLLDIPEDADDNENGSFGLDTWSATASVGVEF